MAMRLTNVGHDLIVLYRKCVLPEVLIRAIYVRLMWVAKINLVTCTIWVENRYV